MKHKFIPIVLIVLPVLLLGIFVRPVWALAVGGVSPNPVRNNVQNVLTITGSDFIDGAVVRLNGTYSLATTFVSATTLTAILPQGFQAGVYNVEVLNPDTTTAVLTGGLTVQDAISTNTPEPDDTPPPSFARPVAVITAYTYNPSPLEPGGRFTLSMTVSNQGQIAANNLILSFSSTDFTPVDTGGVLVIGELAPGGSKQVSQSFAANPALWGYLTAPLEVKISYTDPENQAFNEVFTMSLGLKAPAFSAATGTPTPTPTVQVNRPRLLVISSRNDQEVLQPGSKFTLILEIQNVGSEDARSVTMVVGGASLTGAQSTDTPDYGSYTGSGGDFQNFSPLGSSNIQALGDLPVSAVFTATQELIVNVTTNPGAYPLKVSFVYQNAKGQTLVDDQVITLLVQSVPMIDMSFYRAPGDLFTFQPNILPIQVVNIGRKNVILGNLKVTASNGTLENSTMQVGYLDPGGYLTLDASLIPDMPGPVTITLTLDYIDDFNQLQVITQQMELMVVETPPMEIPGEMGPLEPVMEPTQETFWQAVWRFIRGLIGLDSSPIQAVPVMPGMEEMPPEGGKGSEPVVVPAVPVKGP